jgi:hypothetical protein
LRRVSGVIGLRTCRNETKSPGTYESGVRESSCSRLGLTRRGLNGRSRTSRPAPLFCWSLALGSRERNSSKRVRWLAHQSALTTECLFQRVSRRRYVIACVAERSSGPPRTPAIGIVANGLINSGAGHGSIRNSRAPPLECPLWVRSGTGVLNSVHCLAAEAQGLNDLPHAVCPCGFYRGIETNMRRCAYRERRVGFRRGYVGCS